jgi:hypothetical protein
MKKTPARHLLLLATALILPILIALPSGVNAKSDPCGTYVRWGLVGIRNFQSERVNQIADFYLVNGSGTTTVNGRTVNVGAKWANTYQFLTGFYVDCGFNYLNECNLANVGSIVHCVAGTSIYE